MNFLKNSLTFTFQNVKKLVYNGNGGLSKAGISSLNSRGQGGFSNPCGSRPFGTLRALLPSTNDEARPRSFLTDWSGIGAGSQLGGGGILSPFYIQSRGMKYKGKVKRRCKSCFHIWINGNLYNLCNEKPRHKHQLKPPYYCNQRLLTHATTRPTRPW